uniref:Uncharacterized protein n=1 Tax=uncultured marine virus TaxID=186617 RepID=A0A0F7L398_9VIRU|nr:hypothetical protein [uncultured marine virus]
MAACEVGLTASGTEIPSALLSLLFHLGRWLYSGEAAIAFQTVGRYSCMPLGMCCFMNPPHSLIERAPIFITTMPMSIMPPSCSMSAPDLNVVFLPSPVARFNASWNSGLALILSARSVMAFLSFWNQPIWLRPVGFSGLIG